MNRTIIGAALAACLGVFPGGVNAQSLADFDIPAASDSPEATREVENPSEVETTTNEDLDVEVVSAEDTQDAVNTASSNLIERGGGVKAISTSAGIGFVASGSANYTTSGNPDLALLRQRWASIEAFLNAKRELAQFLNGLSGKGKMTLSRELSTVMNDEFTANNVNKSAEQQAAEAVSAVLRGAIVYDYHDDPEAGRVKVSVVTTPRTMGAVRTMDATTVTAESLQSGLAHILTEIKAGVVPPMGGRTVVVPETGEIVWVGFGTTNVPSSTNPDLAAELEQSALDTARVLANNSLLAIMNGARIDQEGEFAERFDKQIEDYDALLSESGEESVEKKDAAETRRIATQVRSSRFGTVAAGTLPPGVQTRLYELEGTPWVYGVAILRASDSAAASAFAEQMRKNSPLGAVSAQAKKVGFQTNPDGTIKKGPDGKPLLKSLGSGQVTPDKDL